MNDQVNGITRLDGGLAIQADLQRKEVIETIKQTVAKGATDAQLQMFLTLAGRYNLDPFLREIWCAQIGGQMTVMTSRDGYLKIAQRDSNFDGIVSATVCESDVFEIDPITPLVKHAFTGKRGKIIGAYAVAFHKGRRPVVCFAPFSEYEKPSPVWRTYPSAMIVKVAEALALKRQYGISGLVTVEEVDGEPVSAPPQNGTREAQLAVAERKIAELKAQANAPVIEAKAEPVAAAPEPPKPSVNKPSELKPPYFTPKKIQEEFACLRDMLGDDIFLRILGLNGYTAVAQIKSINDARKIWRQLMAEVQNNESKENN